MITVVGDARLCVCVCLSVMQVCVSRFTTQPSTKHNSRIRSHKSDIQISHNGSPPKASDGVTPRRLLHGRRWGIKQLDVLYEGGLVR